MKLFHFRFITQLKSISDNQKIPLLKLDLGCKFTATCSGYIQYTICTRINGEKEEPITFRSTEEFEVHITGDKSLFEQLPLELPDALKYTNGNNGEELQSRPNPAFGNFILTAPTICMPSNEICFY